jgi:hypothetical protein
MSKLDPWEGDCPRPEDVICPGDHDALVSENVGYMINLRRSREVMARILMRMSKSPGFEGDINGAFKWHAPGWDP